MAKWYSKDKLEQTKDDVEAYVKTHEGADEAAIAAGTGLPVAAVERILGLLENEGRVFRY